MRESVGRLECGSRPVHVWPARRVEKELGKNAAYAVIAADLLTEGIEESLRDLWPLVRTRYQQITGREPATTEQDEVRLTQILFRERRLRAVDRQPDL